MECIRPAENGNNNSHGSATSSLPIQDYTQIFRNLSNASRLAIDIGGSLTKIAYFSKVSHRRIAAVKDSIGSPAEFEYENWENPRLHFIKFETSLIEQCLDFIQTHLVSNDSRTIKATGGGAHKYRELIQEKLKVTVEKEDEMSCLIQGANFLLNNVTDEAFKYDVTDKNKEYKFESPSPNIFPYLLVNIGSGVSILKVDEDEKYERVGGTATGGGTFWGLGSLLTGTQSFDKLLELAAEGDHRNVDMLVKDIYAGSLTKLGLDGDTVASSFGKCMLDRDFNQADLVRSLLFTIANDIGQISSLYALRYGLKKIYFGGYFLRNHPVSMSAITFSVNYWGKGDVKPLFLRHEGYLGAIGAFLVGMEGDQEEGCWAENLIGSSGNICIRGDSGISNHIERFEVDKLEPVGFFPLLKSSLDYVPDTVNLCVDQEAREYWLGCFRSKNSQLALYEGHRSQAKPQGLIALVFRIFSAWIDKVPTRAIESLPNHANSVLDRALRCRQKLLSRQQLLNNFPFAYGTLSVRTLLDTIEQTLREYDFPDLYASQKRQENQAAIAEFDSRIQFIDQQEDQALEVIIGVLAGNVFDWGAKEVQELLEGPDNFGFSDARNKLQCRPWLIDGVDKWKMRIREGPAHKCAIIFVDNSGYDFILGILPFVRWLLQRGTQVIISANTNPALNDMTYREMRAVMETIKEKCSIIRAALESSRLHLVSNGQSSPCLDLSRVNQNLNRYVLRQQVDLVIIEGMGRAIHTNLDAKFTCESIKLAVIKNKWLAERLGGNTFSVVFKYEA